MRRLLVFVLIVTLFGSCMESDSNENSSLTVYEVEFTGQTIEEGSEESKLITIDENGFVYFKNQLFNGTKRVYYPDAEISNQNKTGESRILEYEISYKGGIKDGLSKSWYTNGQLFVETNFKDGKHEGLYRSWDFNGQLSLETNYKSGEEDGVFKKWFLNGQLKEQGINKNGMAEGLFREWYENGQLRVEVNYVDGQHDGLYRSWHYNGQLSQKTNYINGEGDGLHQEWYENGKLNTQGINKKGIKDGLWRIWYKNGQLMEEGNYKENYPDGLNRSWYENGILASEANFKNHYLNGLFRWWDENGKLKRKGNYKDDHLDGIWEDYNEERDPIRIENYKLGELIEAKTHSSFYENGNTKLKGPGFVQFNRYLVNYESGLKLKKEPNLYSSDLTYMKHDTEVFLISKTGLKVNPNDTVKVDENIGVSEREWLNIEVEIELKPGDDGYYFDEIEGPARKMIEGYVMDEFLEEKLDSIKNSGVWFSYYETGQINKEELYFNNRIIKSITYYKSGNIAEIIEYRNDYFWEGSVRTSFHENGNIKTISDVEGGGGVSISFDENGEYEGDWDYSGMKDHFDNIVLSKDIREFFLAENKEIDSYLIAN